jgi:hypothetical protein
MPLSYRLSTRRFGELLLERGRLTPAQLDQALQESPEARERLGQTLVRLGLLDEDRFDRRHVQDRRDQVVGERRVADVAVLELDLLHQGEPEPLGRAAFDLSVHALRVEGPPHVLRRRDLHHPDQPEILVDVHDRALRGEGEADVDVALSAGIERLRLAVVVHARLLDRGIQELFDRADRDAAGQDRSALKRQRSPEDLSGRVRAAPHAPEQFVADHPAGQLRRAAGHHRLARRGTGAGGADLGI